MFLARLLIGESVFFTCAAMFVSVGMTRVSAYAETYRARRSVLTEKLISDGDCL